MSEPKRLLDSDGTSDEVRELLSAGAHSPSEMNDEARVAAAAFATKLSAGAVATSAGAGAAAGTTALSTKLLVGLAIVGSVATVTTVAVQSSGPAEPQRQTTTEVQAGEPLVDLNVQLEEAEPQIAPIEEAADREEEEPAPVAIVRPQVPEAEPGDRLAAEAALLERARAELDDSPARTLALTREHRTTFQPGQLAAERELIAVEALLRLGRRAEARARAQRMIDRAPDGMYAQRLRRMLDEQN